MAGGSSPSSAGSGRRALGRPARAAAAAAAATSYAESPLRETAAQKRKAPAADKAEGAAAEDAASATPPVKRAGRAGRATAAAAPAEEKAPTPVAPAAAAAASPAKSAGKSGKAARDKAKAEEAPATAAAPSGPFATVDEAQQAWERLSRQFEALRDARETEPEKLLRQFRENAAAQKKATEALVASLEDKLKSASSGTSASSAALARAQQEVVQAKREAQSAAAKLREVEHKSAALLDWYQRITGLSIAVASAGEKKKGADTTEVTAQLKTSGGEIKFKLVDREGDLMDYVPIQQRYKKHVVAPEYLGAEIEFPKAQLTLFYDQIVRALTQDPE